jgi:hypothetical protein
LRFHFFAGCDAFLEDSVQQRGYSAMAEESEDSPPASSDLEGWRRAVARGQLGSFRPEALLCAVQDLGPDADPRVLNPIAKHLSDIIMKMARGYIGTNKPNKGEDIILLVHGGIWTSLLDKDSDDGRTMRSGLGGIVKFRCLDAIALDNKHSRIPLEPKLRKAKKNENPDTVPMDLGKAREVSHLVVTQDPKLPPAEGGFHGDDAISAGPRSGPDPALFEAMRQLESYLDVERVLAHITDDRKRLAFRLFMEDVPNGSKRTLSIAQAVGISPKWAEVWITELIELLQGIAVFKELTNKKVSS